MMIKTLIEIAKECGANIGDGWQSRLIGEGEIFFDNEAQLKATIDAYNAQVSEPVAWTVIDDTGYISKPYSTKAHAELHYGKTKLVALFTTPQSSQDLISRDDAIQAIINVGGKRVWEFVDAVKSVSDSEPSKEYESMA